MGFTHWPALDARALCLDDQSYLTDNPLVQQPGWNSASRFLGEVLRPSTVGGYYQPLTMISLMFDYAIAGSADNLRPFHATSLVLHVANTLLVMCLLYTLFGRPWIAAGVALLFGLHPMTVETVAWVGERKTLLAAFFAFGCLLAYVGYARKGKWTLYVGCLVLYVLALMSKPTSTPLPLAMLLLDFWPLRRLTGRAVLEKLPLIAVAGGLAVITVISQRHLALSELNAFSTGQTLLLMCHDLVVYPVHMIWPVRLTSLYPFPENISLTNGYLLVGVIAAAAMLVLAILSLRWTRAILTGCLLYGLLLLPTMLNLGYSPAIAWDKYAYLPALGVLIVLAWVLDSVTGSAVPLRPSWRPMVAGIGVVLLAGPLIAGTRSYLKEWQTTERHGAYMLGLAPSSPSAHFVYANALKDRGEYHRAIGHYSRAIELCHDYVDAYINRGIAYRAALDYPRALEDNATAIRMRPGSAEVYCNRGNVYSDMHDYESAIRDYTTAINLRPDFAEAYINRGNAFSGRRDYERGFRDYDKAVELGPGRADVYYIRGNAYAAVRDYARAIEDYSRAVGLRPDYADAHYSRGNAYSNVRDYDNAIRDYTRTIALKPTFEKAYYNRGKAFSMVRDYPRAIQDYSRAVELKPDYPDAYYNRGNAYGKLREYENAISDYTRVIESRPEDAKACYNRGNAYLETGNYKKAVADYDRAIAVKPDYAEAYCNRAVAWFSMKDYERARADVDKCKQLGGRVDPEFIKALAQVSSRPG